MVRLNLSAVTISTEFSDWNLLEELLGTGPGAVATDEIADWRLAIANWS